MRRLDEVGIANEEIEDFAARALEQRSRPHGSSQDWAIYLLLEAVRAVGPDDVGLRLGTFWKNDLAIYFGTVKKCRTIAETNRAVKSYLSSRRQLHFYSDAVDQGEWRMKFATRFPDCSSTNILIEELLARSKHELEYFIGPDFAIKRVELAYTAPRHKSDYEDYFGCPVVWGRSHSAIVVDQDYLSRPCIGRADAELNEEEEDGVDGDARDDREALEAAILETLAFFPGTYPSLKRIATRHGVSTSTIQRRLLGCSMNYRALVDDVRREHVAHYLACTSLPPKEIAHRLGFTNVHNFRRAFSRWMDQTVTQYREQFQTKAILATA
jgi:AraC-like DNA-binding protein